MDLDNCKQCKAYCVGEFVNLCKNCNLVPVNEDEDFCSEMCKEEYIGEINNYVEEEEEEEDNQCIG